MKGDFSRWTLPNAAARGYAGVLMQQGRLHTDADWNEQATLTALRAETALGDVIGRSGAPKEGGGFAISPAPGGFSISAGRFYIDGALIENRAAVTYADQDAPVTPEPLTDILNNGQEALIYLEAWREHVSALDDERLLEPALGGPDTATRVRIRWRVGAMVNPFVGAARAQAIADARKGVALDLADWATGTGAMRAQTAPAAELDDDADCLIPPEAGYLSQENQLYRIEIIRGGPRGQARFVWSRENGSVVAALAQDADGAFVLQGDREDEALGFVSGGWVEVYDAADRFNGRAGRLTRMTLNDGVATFAPAIPAFAAMIEPKVRRWDHPAGSPASGLQLRTTPTLLEHGIQVSFVNGRYRVGDYWVIPARAATGAIDWPPYPAADDAPIPAFGWGRRVAPLALARRSGTGIGNVVDLRALFPRLTCIEASDVYFDDDACSLGADTVQQAIDSLCRRGRGKCTVFAGNAQELVAGINALAPGSDAHVCLGGGMFQLQQTLRIAGLRHVSVSGAGPQSLLTVGGDEAALEIVGCASVSLSDFAVNGGRIGSSGRNSGRLGAVTIRDCGEVSVDRVNAACRAGPYRRASCIAVYGLNRSGPVRVRDCRLRVGQGQVGVQIIAASRAVVENNRIFAAPVPAQVVLDRLRADGALVALIARGMVGVNATPLRAGEDALAAPAGGGAPAAGGGGRGAIAGGDLSVREAARARALETGMRPLRAPGGADSGADSGGITARMAAQPALAGGELMALAVPVDVRLTGGAGARFVTHPLAAGAVADYFDRAADLQIRAVPEMQAHLLNAARMAIRNDGEVTVGGQVFNGFRAFTRRIAETPYFYEGVVIAGPDVEEAQVVGNRIEGAQHGVRIAASAASDPNPPNWRSRAPRNLVERAVVERNRIALSPPAPSLPAHGVYLGHVRSLDVTANEVRGPASGSRDALWHGVRTYGWRGHMLGIMRNALSDLSIGVSVMPALDDRFPEPGGRWIVGGNGMRDVAQRLELAPGVDQWP